MLATVSGYTVAEIDAMTMEDYKMLSRYWEHHPPAHLLLAAKWKFEPPKGDSLDELCALFGIDPEKETKAIITNTLH